MTDPGRQAWLAMRSLVEGGEGRRLLMAACGEFGVTPGAVKLALQLAGGQPRSMGDLAGNLGCDASYVTGLVDELERAGLAERVVHPGDRRVRVVGLTESGAKAVDQFEQVRGVPPAALGALSREELTVLADLLARVLDAG